MKQNINERYKYNQLISIFRKKIFAGEFKESGKLPPERKLAEMFGFSRVTIRTAIQELCEDGLIEQRRGVGNFIKVTSEPTNAPQFPAVERHFGFLCHSSESAGGLQIEEDPYNNQLLLGFLRTRSDQRPFSVDPIPVDPGVPLKQQLEERNIDLRHWDGLLIASPLTESDLNYLETLQVKFVIQGEPLSPRYFSVVTVDNFRGAYDATRHLIEIGRRQPLFLSADFGMPWTERRVAGFRQALLDAGIPFVSEQLVALNNKTRDNAASQMKELLKSGLVFDSVIVLGDWPTVGTLDALKDAGRRIPEDIAVVNYDGYTWLFNSVTPQLTHVVQPFARIGECCVSMLFDLLEHPGREITIKIIPPNLVIRQSTRQPARETESSFRYENSITTKG